MKCLVISVPLFALAAMTLAAQTTVPPRFAMFEPLLGRTWRGEFESSTKEKPVIDISRWELALGGKAVRVMHSINDGEYGGETIIMWDAAKESLVFHYFTTAGFHTVGSVSLDGESIATHESVIGNANGITDVVATYTPMPDGSIRAVASYMKGSERAGGRIVTYVEAPDATVVLP